jgi:hypothetical protein
MAPTQIVQSELMWWLRSLFFWDIWWKYALVARVVEPMSTQQRVANAMSCYFCKKGFKRKDMAINHFISDNTLQNLCILSLEWTTSIKFSSASFIKVTIDGNQFANHSALSWGM